MKSIFYRKIECSKLWYQGKWHILLEIYYWQYILLEKNCIDIMLGKEKLIVDPTKSFTHKDVKVYCAWIKLALTIIYLNEDSEFRKVIPYKNDPRTAWNKLEKHFHPDTMTYHMQFFSQFETWWKSLLFCSSLGSQLNTLSLKRNNAFSFYIICLANSRIL